MSAVRPFIKKLMLLYALSVAVVLIYFLLRILFPQEKRVELRHFNTHENSMDRVQEAKNEIREEEAQSTQKLMLLPQK